MLIGQKTKLKIDYIDQKNDVCENFIFHIHHLLEDFMLNLNLKNQLKKS